MIAPGAFTIRNDASGGEVWHYFMTYDDDSHTSRNPQMNVCDENFTTVQVYSVNGNRVPRIVTSAVVGDQIIIASPDFQTLWGLVGSGVTRAMKADSDDTTVTAIDVPSGICTAWVGSRVAIANGRLIYVSDPVTSDGGSPRTYVGENVMGVPGIVFGLHEGAGGMLVAVTDAGVYGLDSSAASTAQFQAGTADWRLLNHHKVANFGASCVVNGRVYALSERGFLLVDTENDAEVVLNEPMMSIGFSPGRYAMDDFRAARILPGEMGPIIGCDQIGAAVVVDLTQDPPLISWWKTTDFDASAGNYGTSSFGGILQDVDNTQMLVGLHGVYRPCGDFDGGTALSSPTFPTGSLRGVVDSAPKDNLRVAAVQMAASNGGGAVVLSRAAARGVPLTLAPLADDDGITIGVDAWGTTAKRYTASPLTDVRFQFGTSPSPTSDLSFEIGADGGLTRIATSVDVDYSPSAQTRPSNIG